MSRTETAQHVPESTETDTQNQENKPTWLDTIINKWIDWMNEFIPELWDKIASVMWISIAGRKQLAQEMPSNKDVQEYIKIASEVQVNVSKQIQDKLSNLWAAFKWKLQMICDRNNWNMDSMLRIMNAESKLDIKAVNPTTQASWLIQFMPNTAKDLWTTVWAIQKMSALQQLDFVEKYYQKNSAGKPLNSVEDYYKVVFYPAAIWKPKDWVFDHKSAPAQKVADQNPAISKFSTRADGLIDGYAFEKYVNAIS